MYMSEEEQLCKDVSGGTGSYGRGEVQVYVYMGGGTALYGCGEVVLEEGC